MLKKKDPRRLHCLPRWRFCLSIVQNKIFFYSQSDLLLSKSNSCFSLCLTLSAALDVRLLQVGEADKDGLANILLLLRWRVFHSTAAAPGLQQFLQHLNQRTQVGLKWIFSTQKQPWFWSMFLKCAFIQYIVYFDGPLVFMLPSELYTPYKWS